MDKDTLLKADLVKVVGLNGHDLFVRPPSIADIRRINTQVPDDAADHDLAVVARLIVHTVTDAAGVRVFADDDVARVESMPSASALPLIQAVKDAAGLGDDVDTIVEK